MVTLKSYVKMSAADIVEWPCLNIYILFPQKVVICDCININWNYTYLISGSY
jgi:hypothetical protein